MQYIYICNMFQRFPDIDFSVGTNVLNNFLTLTSPTRQRYLNALYTFWDIQRFLGRPTISGPFNDLLTLISFLDVCCSKPLMDSKHAVFYLHLQRVPTISSYRLLRWVQCAQRFLDVDFSNTPTPTISQRALHVLGRSTISGTSTFLTWMLTLLFQCAQQFLDVDFFIMFNEF